MKLKDAYIIAEENIEACLKHFNIMYNQDVQDPKVWITRRINTAKSELKGRGGDYYEGWTRQNFLDGLDTVVDRIPDADKKLQFAKAVTQYRRMAPPDNTKVSSNDEDTLNTAKKEIEKKELTTKPNKKFNARTGRLEDIDTKNFNGHLAMTSQERKENNAKRQKISDKEFLAHHFNSK